VEFGVLPVVVTIRTVVTWSPEPVVRSSGVATSRPVRMTRLTDAPREDFLVHCVSPVAVVLLFRGLLGI
jgi:hypothetical protein